MVTISVPEYEIYDFTSGWFGDTSVTAILLPVTEDTPATLTDSKARPIGRVNVDSPIMPRIEIEFGRKLDMTLAELFYLLQDTPANLHVVGLDEALHEVTKVWKLEPQPNVSVYLNNEMVAQVSPNATLLGTTENVDGQTVYPTILDVPNRTTRELWDLANGYSILARSTDEKYEARKLTKRVPIETLQDTFGLEINEPNGTRPFICLNNTLFSQSMKK